MLIKSNFSSCDIQLVSTLIYVFICDRLYGGNVDIIIYYWIILLIIAILVGILMLFYLVHSFALLPSLYCIVSQAVTLHYGPSYRIVKVS